MVHGGDYIRIGDVTDRSPASSVDDAQRFAPYNAFRSTTKHVSTPNQVEEAFELLESGSTESSPVTPRQKQGLWQRLSAWERGLSLAIGLDILVLLIALVLVLIMRFKFRRDGMESILVDGSCSRAETGSTWIQLFINVLSTALLSTSSYAMQCLMSPTREEVDRAHMNGRYVNIGVPSLFNLSQINLRRTILYVVIVATSIPIHLLANSAVYTTQGSNSYFLFLVSSDFRDSRLSSPSPSTSYTAYSFGGSSDLNAVNITLNNSFITKFNNVVSRSERLDSEQCIRAYSRSFVSNRQHVIAVSKFKHNANLTSGVDPYSGSFLKAVYHQTQDSRYDGIDTTSRNPTGVGYVYKDPSLWTCKFLFGPGDVAPPVCNTADSLESDDKFAIDHWPIDHCLSLPVEEFCQLRGNITIVLAVILSALVKAVVLFATLKTLPTNILATIGDAIVSFLTDPEVSTRDLSLLDRDDVSNMRTEEIAYFRKSNRPSPVYAKAWNMDAISKRWLHTISGRSVFSVALLQSFVFASAIALMLTVIYNFSYLGKSMVWNLWHVGLGVPNLNFIFRFSWSNKTSSLLANVVLVNLFQLVLSCYYFSYNQAWTDMLIAREWAAYARKSQMLRVSEPAGAQRSSYFLTIPYRFAIPLQIASALLHWLLSQSLFLVRIDINSADPFVLKSTSVISTVGYSPIAIVWFIGLFIILTIALWAFAIGVKLKSPMPIVGACSLAISAACHPPVDDERCWLRPLRWGVVDSMEKDGLKHCAFTTREVYSPEVLKMIPDRKGTAPFETVVRFA